MTLPSIAKKGFWLFIMLSATAISLLSLRFLLPNPPHVAPEILENYINHKTAFLAHVTGSLTALLIGPWQFVSRFRTKIPKLHRWTGRIYIIAVLIGGIGGFIIAWSSEYGPIAVAGFALLSVVWLYVTGKGYICARNRQFQAHSRWMLRSFALTAAAVTLRLGLPIAPALGYQFDTGYIALSWASWLINFGIAEIYLRLNTNDFKDKTKSLPASLPM
ncbi:hypothetical protein WH96_10475 [Kiloniella spongiae]|uniref:DUF2306 domain-containing protein n=1 Tax=Kiloniella spongiae TaxID=1489064 RepID=A0A0H2MES1_9PROT|nr:DUF2306 domain-containing protein [Kiloniella spongiae]KLN60878.1 hypothetical protein WH96_10475 [Kiloniella spongiae]